MKWKREKVFIRTKYKSKLVRPLFTLLETKTVFYTLKDKSFDMPRMYRIGGMLVLATSGYTSKRLLTDDNLECLLKSYAKKTSSSKWFIEAKLNEFSTYRIMEAI